MRGTAMNAPLQLMWGCPAEKPGSPIEPEAESARQEGQTGGFSRVLIWDADSRVGVAPHMAIPGLPCTPYRRLKAAE